MAVITVGSYTINSKDIDYIYLPETSYHGKPHISMQRRAYDIDIEYKDVDKIKKAMKEDEIQAHNVLVHQSNLL